MKLLVASVLLLISCIASAQNARWVKTCDMKENGRSDEWRLIEKDTTSKTDTTILFIDSAILDAEGMIVGWKIEGGIVLLKKHPKTQIADTQTVGRFFTTSDDRLMYHVQSQIRKTKPRGTHKTKTARKHRVRQANTGNYYPAAEETKSTFFKGSGEVYDRGDGYVYLINPKGTFYKKKL